MRVPDPEDKKYWYKLERWKLSLAPAGFWKILGEDINGDYEKFLVTKYIEDFRKWKDKLRKLTQTYPFDEFWFDKVKEILGEEASR